MVSKNKGKKRVKKWLFLIGNGVEVRPLEMGRKGPEVHGLFLDKVFDLLPGSHVASLWKLLQELFLGA